MTGARIEQTSSAYGYPLLIKPLLESGVTRAPEQAIIHADKKRLSYRELGERVSGLASGLALLGVEPGDTVAAMDWDSHRYLACFFAVPIGAVLHTINVRLSPEQILYTINHAEDDFILVNSEFLPLAEQIRDRVEPNIALVLAKETDLRGLEDDHRRRGAAASARQAGAGGGHRHSHRLRHVRDLPCSDARSLEAAHGGLGGIDRQVEVRCKTGRPLPVQIRVVDAEKGVISKYGVPERVVFVDALPKTSVGKLDKKVLTVLK